MRMPRSAAVRLFPIDQLSRCGSAVIPAPYRSPMIRPFHVTTKAAVIAAAGWNAVSTAARIAAVSGSGASGSVGRRPPIGHAWVATVLPEPSTQAWPMGDLLPTDPLAPEPDTATPGSRPSYPDRLVV